MVRYESIEYLTRELYLNGEASYLDFLDAQRGLFSATTQYWAGLESYLNSYVALYKALGGGW